MDNLPRTSRPHKAVLSHRSVVVILGTYEVSALTIDTPRGRLLLEPIACEIGGAQGRVDFSVWPSLFRVMLLRQAGDNWIVRTDSGINWPHPWEESTFFELADALLEVS